MAAFTTIAAGAGLAISAAGMANSFVQQGKANKLAKERQSQIDAYNRQELDENPYEYIPISTLGSELLKEEQARNTASLVDTLESVGSRGIGSLGVVQANNNRANRQIAADLDNQMIRKQYAMAGDDVTRRRMMERREEMDLAGLGTALNYNRHMENQWAANALYSGLSLVDGLGSLDPNQRTSASSVTPMGGLTTAGTINGVFDPSVAPEIQTELMPDYYGSIGY